MQNYQHGCVVLLALPFSDTATFKLRPALVLLDTADDDIVVSRITSNIMSGSIPIVKWTKYTSCRKHRSYQCQNVLA